MVVCLVTWAAFSTAFVLSLAEESHPGKVWIDVGGVSVDEVKTGVDVTIRWDYFVSEDDGYAWGYMKVDGSVADTITGNTKATGSFEYKIPEKLCGKRAQVHFCSGSPPRKTKHACKQSSEVKIMGDCKASADLQKEPQPARTTATTTLAFALRELGPLELSSRGRRWNPQRGPLQGPADNVGTAGPPSPDGNFSVAFVTAWLGKLPSYIEEFAASAEEAGATFFIFHTHAESTPSRKNVHFRHMPLDELASRLFDIEAIRTAYAKPKDAFTALVHEVYAEDNPAKGNDLKPLYGALFEKELQSFTHWGWTDLDTIWGNLKNFLTPSLLSSYDVISAPDGARPALYLSGQLTVFKNAPLWRRFFEGCIEGKGRLNYGGCYTEGFLSEANVMYDEKVAMWFAALRQVRIWVDFSMILIGKRWTTLSSRHLHRRDGQLLAITDGTGRGLPSVDIERANVHLHNMQNKSDCFSEFGEGFSYVCVPFDESRDDAYGIAYEIDPAAGLRLWPSPLRLANQNEVEFALLHLHRDKSGFKFDRSTSLDGDWTCYKDGVAGNIECKGEKLDASEKKYEFLIPNIVHFVLTDRDTRFFDWPCYVAIKSAWERLRPSELLVHVLDGVEPATAGDWWKEARKYITSVIPYPRSVVPRSLNGVMVHHPAFIGDFRRMQVLYEWGGIYMDTDALSLRSFDDLRRWKAVFGRQGSEEMRVTVGLMMFEKRSSLAADLLTKMKKAYNGVWGIHAGHVLDEVMGQGKLPDGVAVLGHSTGFFASSWLAADFFELMEETNWIDWNRCWSLHLYNSQTKNYTKDPRMCRDDARYSNGDLCIGLRMATDMEQVYNLVDRGLPVMNAELEQQFEERRGQQSAEYEIPVMHTLDTVHDTLEL